MLHRNIITPVILCGGSGTRLWPLSRQSFPKQFVPLVGNQSLLQLTLARLAWCGNPPMCVASEDHRFLVADAMESQDAAGQVLLQLLFLPNGPATLLWLSRLGTVLLLLLL